MVKTKLIGPPCKCHGEPMRWNNDASAKAGGTWCCVVKQREWQRRYWASPTGREVKRRYLDSPKAQETHRLWVEENRERIRAAGRRYDASTHGVAQRTIQYINHRNETLRPQLEAQLADLQEQRRKLEQEVSDESCE